LFEHREIFRDRRLGPADLTVVIENLDLRIPKILEVPGTGFPYCTVKLSDNDWLPDPAEAVMLRLYWPAEVPFGFDWVPVCVLSEPPPQEPTNISNERGRMLSHRGIRFFRHPLGTASNPNTVIAQNHGARTGCAAALVREVVVTVTFRGAAAAALRLTLAGTEQFAPVGAPVQVMVAVPATPAPPITRL
jgi:hypothetical protein